MRRLAIFFLLSCFTFPAFAAKPINVTELEKLLASAHSRPDAKVAQQLAEVELRSEK